MALQQRGWEDDFFGLGTHHPLMSILPNMDTSSGKNIPVNIIEKPKTWEISAEIPGVDKKDIKVQVDGDVLSLSVERSAAKEDKKEENGVKYHRIERSNQFVQRRVRLPDSADLQKIQAKMDNGVLKLDIPKVEAKVRQHTIAVE